MIDINLIRQDPEAVKQALLKRAVEVDFSELLSWDAERRALISQGDELRSKRNRVSDQIPAMKRQGVDVSSVLAEMKAVSDQIKEIDSRLAGIEAQIKQFLDSLPNMPDDDVVAGGKECNEVVRVWESNLALISQRKTTLIWLSPLDWSTTSEEPSWEATGSGSTRDWGLGWSGRSSTTSSRRTCPTGMSSSCRHTY